jgi:hypothetical protein
MLSDVRALTAQPHDLEGRNVGRFCEPPVAGEAFAAANAYNLSVRSRRALAITETELRLIAAPAMIGLSKRPKKG